jgi:hypothetical protein
MASELLFQILKFKNLKDTTATMVRLHHLTLKGAMDDKE